MELHFFNCTIIDGEPRAIEVAEFRWVKSADLLSYKFPEADLELVERLARPHSSIVRISLDSSIFVLKFDVNCFKNVPNKRAYPLEGEQ